MNKKLWEPSRKMKLNSNLLKFEKFISNRFKKIYSRDNIPSMKPDINSAIALENDILREFNDNNNDNNGNNNEYVFFDDLLNQYSIVQKGIVAFSKHQGKNPYQLKHNSLDKIARFVLVNKID